MKRLLPITITLIPLILVGCGKESDPAPADGRDFDAEEFTATRPYTGRVIDGYLQNARVWLDIDGDGQPTPGPLTLENDSGVELVLPGGEPTAMTSEGGQFSLDVSELDQDPLVSPNLDPRDYPLFAVALPGQTIEESDAGNQMLERAFMLSAPPGVRNVTPLTTLVRQRQVNGIGEFLPSTSDLAVALGNINLVGDYVRAGNLRAHTYARTFARFLSSQLPDRYVDILRNGDGLDRFLSADAVNLMGISFARNALTIVQTVDEAVVDDDYASVDVESLSLPEVDLELDDSLIVTGQKVFARAAGGLPASFTNLDVLADFSFTYAENGRVTSIGVNGCMLPSLTEIVRLVNADGKTSGTATQWLPAVSLNQEAGPFFDEAGIDERLTFDWKGGTAAFETTTSCHGDLAATSELGGLAAIEYEWTLGDDGRVASITATSAGKTEVLTPDYSVDSEFFFGFTRTVNGVDKEVIKVDSALQTCIADITSNDPAQISQVVSAFQSYTLSGDLPIPSGFGGLRLEFDNRANLNRPLRFGFQNESFLDTEGVSSPVGFEWKFFYPLVGSDDFVEEQPNLISTVFIARYSGSRNCGRDFGSSPVTAFARVQYSYQRLSGFLAGLVD